MKEVQPIDQDKIVIVKQAEQEKQLKLVGRGKLKKGHTMYEVNLKTGEVKAAKFEEGIARYRGKVHGSNEV